jgi:dephospho-CoA kinase
MNSSDMPLRIGLTGGIASGKTTVANLFANLDIPVIDTDLIARELVMPGEPALAEIQQQFGDQVLDEAGYLDRRALRRIVFSAEEARHELEAILHPRIGRETLRQANAASGPYQLIVVPLLVGSPLLGFVDRVLVVDCDEDTQLQRLMDRDSETIEHAREILGAQSSREERLAIADDVIRNDQDQGHTQSQVIDLDQIYRRLAERRGQQ